jgi:hypothetical protein
MVAAAAPGAPAVSLTHRGVVTFFVLALMLPVAVGFLAAIAYAARARHPAQGRLRRGLKLIQNTADRGGIGGQERSIS